MLVNEEMCPRCRQKLEVGETTQVTKTRRKKPYIEQVFRYIAHELNTDCTAATVKMLEEKTTELENRIDELEDALGELGSNFSSHNKY
jgi:fatty acid-binding protein DegV